ncbi:hypothetical protein ACWF94_03635 [Streptomyces sp. NPDC055078]
MSPRRGQAHDHAYDTETLQEKADRIRAEQGLPPESRPCHWHDDGHGGRFLIPGCMNRVVNPDVDQCTCKTIQEQLDDARRELAALTKSHRSLQSWHDQIVRAVHDHADGIQIMKRAATEEPSR